MQKLMYFRMLEGEEPRQVRLDIICLIMAAGMADDATDDSPMFAGYLYNALEI